MKSVTNAGSHRFFRVALGLGLVLAVWPAAAQINPFRGNRTQPPLSATDLGLFGESVNRLNRSANLAVGSQDQWDNPATGSHGTSVVTRIFTSAKRPCHAMRHEFFPMGSTTASGYDLTWCRIADGQWKIKS